MMNNNRIKWLAVMLVALMWSSLASAQFYTSRKHDQGTDTLWVYNSWESLYYNGPDTMAVNPNIEVMSPFNMKFKPTEKDNKPLRKMIEKETLAVSVGDSVWLINSRYLRDSLSGQYNKIFENYAPLYFNEKVAFVQFLPTEISYLPIEIDSFEGLYAGVGVDGIFNAGDYGYVAVPHFIIDFSSKSLNLVDRTYLLHLLEHYPDMKRRYEMMEDQNEFYMINQFFWDYVERLSHDPTVPSFMGEFVDEMPYGEF